MLKVSSFLTIVWWSLLKSMLSSSSKSTTEYYHCDPAVWVLSSSWGDFFVLFFVRRCFGLLYCKSSLVYLFWILMLKFSSFLTMVWWSLLKSTFLTTPSRFLLYVFFCIYKTHKFVFISLVAFFVIWISFRYDFSIKVLFCICIFRCWYFCLLLLLYKFSVVYHVIFWCIRMLKCFLVLYSVYGLV